MCRLRHYWAPLVNMSGFFLGNCVKNESFCFICIYIQELLIVFIFFIYVFIEQHSEFLFLPVMASLHFFFFTFSLFHMYLSIFTRSQHILSVFKANKIRCIFQSKCTSKYLPTESFCFWSPVPASKKSNMRISLS